MKNTKYKILNIRYKITGFSLIELLVVVALIGIIGYLTTSIFVLGFRTQAKSEILKEVKQNGDYAMTIMERMIRSAADIPNPICGVPNSELTILNQEGYITTFKCDESGHILQENGGFPAGTPPVTYNLTSDKVIVPTVGSGPFKCFTVVCPTPPTNPKYVYIEYTINQSGNANIPVENQASMPYQSTVSLRNYSQ
jgi:prepilin-type N-terminal cleavage/methylation domain-containing protein